MKTKQSIQSVPMYQPGKPLEEVKRELGLDQIIKMASNENPFGCSKSIYSSLISEKDSFSFYPESTSPLVREKLADHLELDSRRLIMGNGSDEIVQLIAQVYLELGNESVMADLTFPRYNMVTCMAGAKSIQVPLKNGVHNLEEMLKVITEKTKIIWICNPNNPTGTITDHNTLSSFLDALPQHVLTVVDEAYHEYVTDSMYPDSLSLLEYNPRLLILRTFSKIYGLAAFRVGYGIGHPDVVQELHRVRDPFNVNRLAQKAAVAALDDQEFVASCRIKNDLGRKQIIQKLDEWNLPYYPAHGNFILFDTRFSGEEVFQFLLRKGIIVRSGTKLGFPTYIRVTIGTQDQNEHFLHGMETFLQQKGAI